MRLPRSAILCDAIEIGALQLGVGLSAENILAEAFANSKDERDIFLVSDAFAIAVERSKACPVGYPFDATPRMLRPKRIPSGFNPYLFQLLGVSVSQRGMLDRTDLARRFRRDFEDFVCWACKRSGLIAQVLSEPRSIRGLPTSLLPALARVSGIFGQGGKVIEAKLAPHDNDLDVDVIAAACKSDSVLGGWPIFLLQCATGPVQELHNKILEVSTTFCSVWETGFHRSVAIRGGATPDDLLRLDDVFWGRLSEAGLILHRTRLVNFSLRRPQRNVRVPARIAEVESDLRRAILQFDWRNGWQA